MDVLIENLCLHITNKILALTDESKKEIIDNYITDHLDKSSDWFRKKYEEHGFDNWFHRIECTRKWSIFRSLLKQCPFKDEALIKEFLEVNSKYQDEVISIRNKFAHAKTEEKDGIKVLRGQLGQDDFEYDDNEFKKIRSNLRKHRKNFNSIFEKLGYS